ncbi:MAG: Amuc_1100 family pilus-like protein [Verrucomicrobiota bacterium]
MARFKSHPIFSSLLAMCGLAALAEVYLLVPLDIPFNVTHGRSEALKALEDAHVRYAKLQKEKITPTPENLKAIEHDREQAEKALATTRDYINGVGGLAQKMFAETVPKDSVDAYFAIQIYQRNQKAKFMEAAAASEAVDASAASDEEKDDDAAGQRKPEKLKFKENDSFGFGAYKQSGPSDPEIIRQVFRQSQLADYLLSALLAAKPLEFISLLREAPLTKAAREEQDKTIKDARDKGEVPPVMEPPGSATPEEAADYFAIDPLVSARVPGAIDTTAFQITFIGRTKVARDFLNKMAARELPLKVVGFSAEADEPTPPPPVKTVYDEEGNPIPLKASDMPKTVAPALYTKYTIVVEYAELVTPSSDLPASK